MGGVHKTCGNSGGVGGYLSVQKMEIPGRRGGLVRNSLRGGGYGYFLELHNTAKLVLVEK